MACSRVEGSSEPAVGSDVTSAPCDLKRGRCQLSFRLMQRRMRLSIRVAVVNRLYKYIGQQGQQNSEPNVQHRCATVFASAVHVRCIPWSVTRAIVSLIP